MAAEDGGWAGLRGGFRLRGLTVLPSGSIVVSIDPDDSAISWLYESELVPLDDEAAELLASCRTALALRSRG